MSGAGFEIALGLAVSPQNAGNDAYKPQNYTFRYAVDPEELRSRSSYETVPSNYGMEMYYAEQAQQELERRQAAAAAVSYRQENTRRRRYTTQSAPQVIYYQQSSNPAPARVNEYSVTEIESMPRAPVRTTQRTITRQTVQTQTPAPSASGKMNRQMSRRLNCKNCR